MAKEESFYCGLPTEPQVGFVGSSYYIALSIPEKEIGFINGLNHVFSQKCYQATIVSEVSVCAS